jgi:CHAD domain-containing protein
MTTTEHEITNQVAERVAALLTTPQIFPVLAAAMAEIDPESLHGTQRQIRHRMFQIRGRVLELLDHELLADSDIDTIISAVGYMRDKDVVGEHMLKFEPLVEPATPAANTAAVERQLKRPAMATAR